jgi:hypothetical protein
MASDPPIIGAVTCVNNEGRRPIEKERSQPPRSSLAFVSSNEVEYNLLSRASGHDDAQPGALLRALVPTSHRFLSDTKKLQRHQLVGQML